MQDTLGNSPEVLLFADEMVASINRVNYNQNNSLNAMAGIFGAWLDLSGCITPFGKAGSLVTARVHKCAVIYEWAILELHEASEAFGGPLCLFQLSCHPP